MSSYHSVAPGSIEVICGPMFSGKTEELVRRVRLAQIARQRVQVFKSAAADHKLRQEETGYSHFSVEVQSVEKALGVLSKLYDSTRVVGIDEIQLFDDTIVKVVTKIAQRGIRVICAGLDLNFSGHPFGPMPTLLALADYVDKVYAVCTICGRPASKTYCLMSEDSPQIVTGDKAFFKTKIDDKMVIEDVELFEARCNVHYDIDEN